MAIINGDRKLSVTQCSDEPFWIAPAALQNAALQEGVLGSEHMLHPECSNLRPGCLMWTAVSVMGMVPVQLLWLFKWPQLRPGTTLNGKSGLNKVSF